MKKWDISPINRSEIERIQKQYDIELVIKTFDYDIKSIECEIMWKRTFFRSNSELSWFLQGLEWGLKYVKNK